MTEQELNKACETYCTICKQYNNDFGCENNQVCSSLCDFRKAMSNSCNSFKNLQEFAWEDVQRLFDIGEDVKKEGIADLNAKQYCEEVLKRFKEGANET